MYAVIFSAMTDTHSDATKTATQALVLNTCPDVETARKIADTLVKQQLAACVNILPAVESVYRWEGQIQHDNEALLIIKTHVDCYPALQQAIEELHPYELPEIVMVSIDRGLPEYLRWINHSLDVPS